MPHKFKGRPDETVTRGEVRKAYASNYRRTIVLGVLFAVLAVSFLAYTAQQARAARSSIYQQCELRRASLIKANAFYGRMAVIERGDVNADAATRTARVHAYASLVYRLPDCASL